MALTGERYNGTGGWDRQPTWFIRILPQLEETAAYEMVEFSGSTFEVDAGWAAPNRSWRAMDETRVGSYSCPSSTLPKTWTYATSASTQTLGAPASIEVQIVDYAANSGTIYRCGTLDYHETALNPSGGLNWGRVGNIADNGFMG